MEPELMQQYITMINHNIADDKAQAQAVLSNILSAKLASKLQAHNSDIMTLNRMALNTKVDTAPAADAAPAAPAAPAADAAPAPTPAE